MRAFIKNYIEAEKARREEEGREAGFSLIELIIVVVILGILVAIAIPVFAGHPGSGAAERLKPVAANGGNAGGRRDRERSRPTTRRGSSRRLVTTSTSTQFSRHHRCDRPSRRVATRRQRLRHRTRAGAASRRRRRPGPRANRPRLLRPGPRAIPRPSWHDGAGDSATWGGERMRGRGADAAGFSLVEVIIAMFLLGIVAVAILPALWQGIVLSSQQASTATATRYMNSLIDDARATPTCPYLGVDRLTAGDDRRARSLSLDVDEPPSPGAHPARPPRSPSTSSARGAPSPRAPRSSTFHDIHAPAEIDDGLGLIELIVAIVVSGSWSSRSPRSSSTPGVRRSR